MVNYNAKIFIQVKSMQTQAKRVAFQGIETKGHYSTLNLIIFITLILP